MFYVKINNLKGENKEGEEKEYEENNFWIVVSFSILSLFFASDISIEFQSFLE